jgi:hypothetical protein
MYAADYCNGGGQLTFRALWVTINRALHRLLKFVNRKLHQPYFTFPPHLPTIFKQEVPIPEMEVASVKIKNKNTDNRT